MQPAFLKFLGLHQVRNVLSLDRTGAGKSMCRLTPAAVFGGVIWCVVFNCIMGRHSDLQPKDGQLIS